MSYDSNFAFAGGHPHQTHIAGLNTSPPQLPPIDNLGHRLQNIHRLQHIHNNYNSTSIHARHSQLPPPSNLSPSNQYQHPNQYPLLNQCQTNQALRESHQYPTQPHIPHPSHYSQPTSGSTQHNSSYGGNLLPRVNALASIPHWCAHNIPHNLSQPSIPPHNSTTGIYSTQLPNPSGDSGNLPSRVDPLTSIPDQRQLFDNIPHSLSQPGIPPHNSTTVNYSSQRPNPSNPISIGSEPSANTSFPNRNSHQLSESPPPPATDHQQPDSPLIQSEGCGTSKPHPAGTQNSTAATQTSTAAPQQPTDSAAAPAPSGDANQTANTTQDEEDLAGIMGGGADANEQVVRSLSDRDMEKYKDMCLAKIRMIAVGTAKRNRLTEEMKEEVDELYYEFQRDIHKLAIKNRVGPHLYMAHIGHSRKVRGGLLWNNFLKYDPEPQKLFDEFGKDVGGSKASQLWATKDGPAKKMYRDVDYLISLQSSNAAEIEVAADGSPAPIRKIPRINSCASALKGSQKKTLTMVTNWALKMEADLKSMAFFHQVEGFFVLASRHPKSTVFQKGGSPLGHDYLAMIAGTEDAAGHFHTWVAAKAIQILNGVRIDKGNTKQKLITASSVSQDAADEFDLGSVAKNVSAIRAKLKEMIRHASGNRLSCPWPGAKTKSKLEKLNLKLAVAPNNWNIRETDLHQLLEKLREGPAKGVLACLNTKKIQITYHDPGSDSSDSNASDSQEQSENSSLVSVSDADDSDDSSSSGGRSELTPTLTTKRARQSKKNTSSGKNVSSSSRLDKAALKSPRRATMKRPTGPSAKKKAFLAAIQSKKNQHNSNPTDNNDTMNANDDNNINPPNLPAPENSSNGSTTPGSTQGGANVNTTGESAPIDPLLESMA